MDESSTSGSKGLFGFLSSRDGADKSGQSVSDVWDLSQDQGSRGGAASLRPGSSQQGSKWFLNPELLPPQPSPAVMRTRTESHALRRKSGTSEKIQTAERSLKAIREVVSSAHPTATTQPYPSHTPGSLLKESFRHPSRSTEATPPGHTPLHFTPLTGTPLTTPASSRRVPETPKASLSIMDESGMTRELFMAATPARDVTILEPSRVTHMTLFEDTVLGQPETTMMEDPQQKAASELVTSFHRCVSAHPNPASVLELVGELEKNCEFQFTRLKEMEKETKSSLSPQILMELNLERSTWQLVRVLFIDRVESEQEEDMITELMPAGLSDKQIGEEYFLRDSTVRQAQVVVDWLEENSLSNLESYPVKVNYFADSVKWENTLHDIQHGISRGHIVSEMDPDASTRQGKPLSELDGKDELTLVRHLFTCVRAGQFSKAQELCLQCGQPWRAAALEGWKLYHDPNVGKNMSDELELPEGNLSRDLWKAACWEMASDPGYSVYEKAIYAALSGNLKHLLPACQSWFDYVWAYFKVMVDILTEQKLRSSPRGDGHSLEDLPPDYWNTTLFPEVIFQEIDASPSQLIRKQSQNRFHVVQKLIILNDMEGLASVIHQWLEDSPSIHQLRFMAHLVVFIRGLGVPVEEDKCTEIMEAYVKSLIQHKYSALVALYASRLPPPLQVTCYSHLLEGVHDSEEQKMCLELGKDAGLDVAAITKTVVENIRSEGMEESLGSPSLELGKEVEITKLDWSKIEVINWLVFEESQRAEAIRQGNALVRAFLAMRKHSAAREVFRRIPPDSIDVVNRNWQKKAGSDPLPPQLSNDIREYHCIQAYLDANDAFSLWFQHFHHRKPEPPSQPTGRGFTDQVAYEHRVKQYQMEGEHWQQQLNFLTGDAETKLYNVLLFVGGGWMVDEPHAGPVEESRVHQMSLLRQLCLPRMVFLLHTILHSTEQFGKCLQLADIVASEKSQLYMEFRQDELEKILSLLQSSAHCLLDDQYCDELGYTIA